MASFSRTDRCQDIRGQVVAGWFRCCRTSLRVLKTLSKVLSEPAVLHDAVVIANTIEKAQVPEAPPTQVWSCETRAIADVWPHTFYSLQAYNMHCVAAHGKSSDIARCFDTEYCPVCMLLCHSRAAVMALTWNISALSC